MSYSHAVEQVRRLALEWIIKKVDWKLLLFGKNVALFIFFKNYDDILMDLNCYQHGCVLSCLSIDLFH